MSKILRRLTELLGSDDLELRIAAIRVITEIGFASKPVVQALGRCLREPHDELRLVALRALARLGARDVVQWVVPLILSSGPLRDQAMAVIASVGPSVIPQLKELYPQADFHGKRAVVTAVSRIGGKPSLAFLLKILPSEPFELQKHLTLSICETLDRLTPAAQAPIYSGVLRLLRRKDLADHPQILATGAILLGHFRGPSLSARVRNELRSFADKKYPPEVRRHALVSYNRFLSEGKLSNGDHQFLLRALSDEDWHNVAQHALSGFQRLELEKGFLPKLINLLHKSPHFSVHIHVFERLQSSDRPEVAEAILPFLSDSRFRVREAAEAALRKMPTSIESLFALLMKTDDLEVTQRINAILREYPQETRQKYVERASSRLLGLFEENDPHYKSFLDFVKSLDPEPLRKRIYEKAVALKKGKARDKWERIQALIQILWDNHLITSEGRYLLAVAMIHSSPKDLAPASRRANLGLRVLRSLVYDDHQDLVKRLTADKDLGPEEFFYLGFHFSEEGDDMRPFATAMLEHVVKKFPKSKSASTAKHKLELQAKAAAIALEEAQKAQEAARKKELKKQKKAQAAAMAQHPAALPAAGGGSPLPKAAAAEGKVTREPVRVAAASFQAANPRPLPPPHPHPLPLTDKKVGRVKLKPKGKGKKKEKKPGAPRAIAIRRVKRGPVAAAKTASKKRPRSKKG
jgi:hypothetical protein